MENYRTQQSIYDQFALRKLPTDIEDAEITALGLLRDRLLNEIALKTSDVVLEIGVSDGKVLHKIKRDYSIAQGIGIDVSPESLKGAKQNNKLGNHFVVADAHALPVSSHILDWILAFDVFEHVENLETVLMEACRCLKPGGGALIHVPVSGGNRLRGKVLASFARLFRHPNWHKPETVGHFSENIRPKKELVRLLTEKGFKIRSNYTTSVFFQPLYDYILISFLKSIWQRIFMSRFPRSDTFKGLKRSDKDKNEFHLRRQISTAKKSMMVTAPFLILMLAVDRVLCRLGVEGGAAFIVAEKGIARNLSDKEAQLVGG